MSRLWPKQITVGLFPGAVWVRSGKRPIALSTSKDGSNLLSSLEELLSLESGPDLSNSRIDVLVSHSLSRVISLPWQNGLQAPRELAMYAQAAFARSGIELDDGWEVDASFKLFQEAGLALALPRDWISDLEQVVSKYGGRLRSVMPLAAHAYWSSRRMLGRDRALILLEERDQICSLAFERGRLFRIDMQPKGDVLVPSMQQLLSRFGALNGPIDVAMAWSATGEPQTKLIKTCLPSATVRPLDRHHWESNG